MNKLLKAFSDISDVELITIYKKTIHDYQKYKLIEKLILEIINNMGEVREIPINYELENRYRKMNQLAIARKIAIPTKKDKIVIKKIDIINQIKETLKRETANIEANSYLYDGYYDGLENDHLNPETKKNSLDLISETEELYSKVLEVVEPTTKTKTK